MSLTEFVTIVTLVVGLATVSGLLTRFGGRQQKFQSDIEYLRRDVNQLLGYFRLTPAEQKDRDRRR